VTTISEARQKLLRGDHSCSELVEEHLQKIEKGAHLNAFTFIDPAVAVKTAQAVDEHCRVGKPGKLAGAIIAIKDNIVMRDQPAGCASKILDGYISPYSATVVEKLLSEDAVIIGRANMDEFAMGSSTENSSKGTVLNPHDETRVPGGSSGGSTAAVAAGLVNAALGSDTGGSIRQPAAFCGVVGLKPTYGRVSRYGLVAFASSLDQIGPITNTVEDSALLLGVISGKDQSDATSTPETVPEFSANLEKPIRGLKIGLPKEYFSEGLDDQINKKIREQAKVLKEHGAELVEVSLPMTEHAIATYYLLATAEASSNLSRFDGARYGFRAKASNLQEMYCRSRSLGFGEEVKLRIMLGTYVLSAGYYEAYYEKAQKVRTLIRQDFERAFQKCDCLLTPTTPTTAFKIGEKVADPLAMYLSDVFTVSVNLAGLPAISVPCGKDDSDLPIGLQLIGRQFDEITILQIARAVERNAS